MLRFFFFILITQAVHARTLKNDPVLPGINWDKSWFQNACTLSNIKREARTYPGIMCAFLDDGSFLSVGEKSLKRFSPTKSVLWETPGHYHHQLNLSEDKKSILTLTSEITKRGSKKVRDDIFLILDMNGKILHAQSAIAILEQAKVAHMAWEEGEVLNVMKADNESSHFNSIYEIPENIYSQKISWLKKGNIVVNSFDLGIFILSPDLKKLLYHKILDFSHKHGFHDVQVNKEGEFLLFNNFRIHKTEKEILHSAIQKYDPVTEKITFEYKADTKKDFYSPACGGVQEMGDLIFFSDIVKGGYFYSKKKKKIVLEIPGTNGDPSGRIPTQQIKLVDMKSFFRHSK